MQQKPLSIIIPAFNEEQYIAATLDSILSVGQSERYEVIVVDNGSTDATAEIVRQSGALLVSFPEGESIAAVRNKGAERASGDVLIFIDADVIVTEQWHQQITQTAELLKQQPDVITGSRCLAPNLTGWLNKYWFSLLNQYQASYINSGHLITSEALFRRIKGFSEHLKTAEDYDFCMRAVKNGAKIIENKKLPVIHDGYPKTITEFIQRERWHGKEDFNSFRAIQESKLAWIVLLIIALFMVGLIHAISTYDLSILFLNIGIMYLLSIVLTRYKFGRMRILALINTATIFSFYLWGRILASMDRMIELLAKSK